MRVSLQCHRAASSAAIARIEVELQRVSQGLQLSYQLSGDIGKLKVPAPQPMQRRDELWRHTCCELFIATPDQASYLEFNFSPSGEWAAYKFNDYRQGMAPAQLAVPPQIELISTNTLLELRVRLQLDHVPFIDRDLGTWQLGLTAVIEDNTGQLSYWALSHPSPQPDFHHLDGFVLAI
jgi:hypothetical protein